MNSNVLYANSYYLWMHEAKTDPINAYCNWLFRGWIIDRMMKNSQVGSRSHSTSHLVNPPVVTVLDFCKSSEDIADLALTEPEFLYEERFKKYAPNMLLSSEGVGKSQFVIEVVEKSVECRKVFFLLTEELDGGQLARYQTMLLNTEFNIMTYEDWQDWVNNVRDRYDNGLKHQASQQASRGKDELSKFMDRYYKILNQLRNRHCIKKDAVFSEVLCFMLLVEDIKAMGFDTIVVDSLLGLENGSYFTRKQLSKMLHAISSAKMTSIWIHHLNSKGENHGPRDVLRVMDYVYYLDVAETKEDGSVVLELKNGKHRYQAQKNLYLYREKISAYEAKYTKQDDYVKDDSRRHKQLGTAVISILEAWEKDVITREELENAVEEHIGELPPSLGNILTNLGKKNVIQMVNKNNWKAIRIVRPN